MTEMEALKKKKKGGKATAEDLTRLKQLQDGEPLSAADLDAAKKREADRVTADKTAFDAKHAAGARGLDVKETSAAPSDLDVPAEHPRITAIKQVLMPFTQIEAHDSRPNEFILFTRGISITAGDVRKARQAMKL